MANENMSVSSVLRTVNVNNKLDNKPTGKGSKILRYLPWSSAWDEILKRYPDSTYEVITFDDAGKRAENSLPYQRTQLGYMVWTRITIEGTSREMWLPVMDGNNNPLMDSPYTVTNKWGNETQIAPINISDVNRSIMRCLVKNLAMFGLGLYIYSKDDLPSEVDVDNETGEVIEPDAAPAPAAPVPTPTLEEAYALKVKVGKATFPMGDLVEKATNPEKGKRALERLAAVDTEEGAAAKVILDALASGAVHFPPAAAAQA